MAKQDERGFITKLDPGEIFVFGSNTAGRHGMGAARQAAQKFGAEYGVGEGLTGRCCAFPTLDDNLQQLSWARLVLAKDRFLMCAKGNPHKRFLVTKLGCGLAGYSEDYMASLFSFSVPDNVVLPEGW